VAKFDGLHVGALFVEQESADIDRNLRMDRPVFSFIASSRGCGRICRAADSVLRIWPVPVHRGQGM